jgi:hypothetical protein
MHGLLMLRAQQPTHNPQAVTEVAVLTRAQQRCPLLAIVAQANMRAGELAKADNQKLMWVKC